MYEFYKKYFLLNLKDYPNIGIDLPINQIIFAFLIGIIIAIIAVNYNRSCMSLLIKRLTRNEAFSEESAKTLEELGIYGAGIKRLISSDRRISRIVKIAGQKDYSYEEYRALQKQKGFKERRINFEKDKFFLEEDKKDDAKQILSLGSASAFNVALFCVFLMAIFACLMFLMPDILNFINNSISK